MLHNFIFLFYFFFLKSAQELQMNKEYASKPGKQLHTATSHNVVMEICTANTLENEICVAVP